MIIYEKRIKHIVKIVSVRFEVITIDTNEQPIRFLPVIFSDKCPYCNEGLLIIKVKVAIYNKHNVETGYANRSLLKCCTCNLYFANQHMQKIMKNQILPNHFEFFFLDELRRTDDKDLLIKKTYYKYAVPNQNQ